ncbi:Tab2/Atab2 family RNA-binding protein [Gloeocapsopsis dulcis]|uniref:DUF1092 domain-containing protein n=1 Tax=Gloeocapsopsis dulcis AAB1 = 1H9 TaxID=1433147 RepID=A0A6N8FUG7_9CHRO|nr:Tab2/Atab2 family RNA-binding protein [Gloeocapsopsis dulcis]MUL36591.1 hypothetical protein [Gloeocapsopsis dulcis AAB1 = 1H9]WNN87216.1 Tab2/Atab2 family RNA-binding protein [Gloeocapsopsis dulcis]
MAQIIWQADFYRRPLRDAGGQALWELLVCDSTRTVEFVALCPQSQANAHWLVEQLQLVADKMPDTIQIFRPQSLSLLTTAGEQLGTTVEATRRTYALKQWLQERSPLYRSMNNYTGEAYDLLTIEKPPPTPLPEKLWGEQWRFAALSAKDVEAAFQERPIPILDMPPALMPLQLGLASNISVPGVIIYGGRQSMRLTRWIQQTSPIALNYIGGAPDGLVLEADLADRWIVATFEDREVSASAQIYEQRKQQSKGLHFLLVQPDNSDVTFSGFWLLRQD